MVYGAVLAATVLTVLGGWALLKRDVLVLSPLVHYIVVNAFLWVAKPLATVLTDDWAVIDQALGTRDDNFLFTVFLAASVGAFGFLLGYANRAGAAIGRRIRIPQIDGDPRVIRVLAISFAVVGLLAFARYHPTPFASTFTAAQEKGQFVTQTAYVAWFCYHIWGVGLLLWTARGTRWWGLALMAAFAFLVLYGGWHRAFVFSLLLGVIITDRLSERRRSSNVILIACLVVAPAALRVWATIGQDRAYVQRVVEGSEQAAAAKESAEFQWDYFTSVAGLGYFMQAVPREVNFRWGTTYLDVPLKAIPRVLWKDKREVFAPMAGPGVQTVGHGRFGRGTTFTMFAELYYEFGWLGVFGGMYLAGVLWRAAYHAALQHASNPYLRVIYAGALANWMVWIHHGHLEALPVMYVLVMPVALGLAIEMYRRRRPEPSGLRPDPPLVMEPSASARS